MKKKLYVTISLDVEEEGLFSGHYAKSGASVKNIPLLRQLKPLKKEFGFPPTLFCAHSVFQDAEACKTLEWMKEQCGAEIGAHLHHWNTPPESPLEDGSTPMRTHLLPPELLGQRLDTLFGTIANFNGSPPKSFRMGRWDLKALILPMLAQRGITVDSSICPLRVFPQGADHFLAPADPWFHTLPNGQTILEAPITQLPIARSMARLWHGMWRAQPKIADFFHFFGALSPNPLWHGDAVMREATRMHTQRGGKVLGFFWHSSEMMPGGSPHVPDQAAADKLLQRIFHFCGWLHKNYDIQGITMSELPTLDRELHYPVMGSSPDGDW